MTFQSLLVPHDLTASTDRVLDRLTQLPLAAEARITLLHAVPTSLTADERQSAEADARKTLERDARHLRKRLPRRALVETVVKSGSAFKEIATLATKQKADLVVMGRGSGRAVRDAFLGSTAERVIRQAKLPVLVVRLPARKGYQRPALAVDLDPASQDVVRMALCALPTPRPRITVIHAFDTLDHSLVYPSLSRYQLEERPSAQRVEASHKLGKLLATTLAKLAPEDKPDWKPHVRFGSPRKVVEQAVKNGDCDLLVLGTRAHAGAAYVLLGTVAGDVLRAAKCDVLIVPPVKRRA